jgi:hypothetical protein
MFMSQSVDAALAETEHEARDGATVALVRLYAATIDDAADGDMTETLRELGPKLLAALEALGMSPRARSAATRGAPGGTGPNPLDELRQRRAGRAGAS